MDVCHHATGDFRDANVEDAVDQIWHSIEDRPEKKRGAKRPFSNRQLLDRYMLGLFGLADVYDQ
jgi:hypothetical protein